jgi:hypothetical protein
MGSMRGQDLTCPRFIDYYAAKKAVFIVFAVVSVVPFPLLTMAISSSVDSNFPLEFES